MSIYLVRHDGAVGGDWAWIEAASPTEILAAFRDLVIVDPWPEWATEKSMETFGVYTLGGEFDGFLLRLLR